MQVDEATIRYHKTLSVHADIYERLLSLKKENQTLEDVLSQSLDALEEKNLRDIFPCIDDAYVASHAEEWDAAEADFEESYVSLEEVVETYREQKKA